MLRPIFHAVGPAIRSAGVAMEKFGIAMGAEVLQPAYVTHKKVDDVDEPSPIVGPTNALVPLPDRFVAPCAAVSADVVVEKGASIWYLSAISGKVTVAANACVMDGVTVDGARKPVTIGAGALVAARASLASGVTLAPDAIVCAGAVLEEGASVASGAIVGPGARVPAGAKVPEGEYWAGAPATKLRAVEPAELAGLRSDADSVRKLAPRHAAEHAKDVFTQQDEREAFANRFEIMDNVYAELEDWDVFVPEDKFEDFTPERPGIAFERPETTSSVSA